MGYSFVKAFVTKMAIEKTSGFMVIEEDELASMTRLCTATQVTFLTPASSGHRLGALCACSPDVPSPLTRSEGVPPRA
jgi:hypothetical protein